MFSALHSRDLRKCEALMPVHLDQANQELTLFHRTNSRYAVHHEVQRCRRKQHNYRHIVTGISTRNRPPHLQMSGGQAPDKSANMYSDLAFLSSLAQRANASHVPTHWARLTATVGSLGEINRLKNNNRAICL